MKTMKRYYAALMVATGLIMTSSAFAAGGDGSNITPPPNTGATGLSNSGSKADLATVQQRTTDATDFILKILREGSILIGLVLVIKSLMFISAVSKGEKQGSVGLAFIGLFVGGMMTAVPTWLMFFGNSAKDIVGVQAG